MRRLLLVFLLSSLAKCTTNLRQYRRSPWIPETITIEYPALVDKHAQLSKSTAHQIYRDSIFRFQRCGHTGRCFALDGSNRAVPDSDSGHDGHLLLAFELIKYVEKLGSISPKHSGCISSTAQTSPSGKHERGKN